MFFQRVLCFLTSFCILLVQTDPFRWVARSHDPQTWKQKFCIRWHVQHWNCQQLYSLTQCLLRHRTLGPHTPVKKWVKKKFGACNWQTSTNPDLFYWLNYFLCSSLLLCSENIRVYLSDSFIHILSFPRILYKSVPTIQVVRHNLWRELHIFVQ